MIFSEPQKKFKKFSRENEKSNSASCLPLVEFLQLQSTLLALPKNLVLLSTLPFTISCLCSLHLGSNRNPHRNTCHTI